MDGNIVGENVTSNSSPLGFLLFDSIHRNIYFMDTSSGPILKYSVISKASVQIAQYNSETLVFGAAAIDDYSETLVVTEYGAGTNIRIAVDGATTLAAFAALPGGENPTGLGINPFTRELTVHEANKVFLDQATLANRIEMHSWIKE